MLKVRGLSKQYPDTTSWALKPTNFDVKPGEHLFVIGETGSGKSTLLQLVGGKAIPSHGEVNWKGKQMNFEGQLLPGFEGMNLVAQQALDKPFNTVDSVLFSNLEVGLPKAEQQRRVRMLKNIFSLQRMGNKKGLELSGGQQQRLALARVFANLPDLLLLDEPFAHLDPQVKNQVFDHLTQSVEQNGTMAITVTHDYTETLKYAHRVIVLRRGKVEQKGRPNDLYREPRNLYVAGLLGEYNLIETEQGQLFCRPESVVVSPVSDLRATVESIRFVGHYLEVEFKLEEQILRSFQPAQIDLKIGQQVGVKLKDALWVENNGKLVTRG